MFCKHKWIILSEQTTKSQFKHAMEVVASSSKGNVTIPHQMCNADRKVIQILSCEKCGKLKKFVETI